MEYGIASTHRYLSTAIDSTALALNVVLLFLILTCSKFQIRQFKQVFLLTCIGDSLLTAVTLVGGPYLLFDGGYLLLVANGPFSWHNALFDHVIMAAFCTMLYSNIVLVGVQFVWRTTLICKEESIIKSMKQTFLAAACLCMIQFFVATWCWTSDQDKHQEEALGILRRNGWTFDNETSPYPSVTAALSAKTKIHHGYYLASSAVVYAVIVRSQCGVVKHLRRFGAPTHSLTYKAQAEVNRALIALAITPLFTLVPTAIMVGSNVLEISLGTFSAYLTLALTLITLLNPITAIFFVRSYREGFLGLIGVRNRDAVVTPITSGTLVSALFDPATRVLA